MDNQDNKNSNPAYDIKKSNRLGKIATISLIISFLILLYCLVAGFWQAIMLLHYAILLFIAFISLASGGTGNLEAFNDTSLAEQVFYVLFKTLPYTTIAVILLASTSLILYILSKNYKKRTRGIIFSSIIIAIAVIILILILTNILRI